MRKISELCEIEPSEFFLSFSTKLRFFKFNKLNLKQKLFSFRFSSGVMSWWSWLTISHNSTAQRRCFCKNHTLNWACKLTKLGRFQWKSEYTEFFVSLLVCRAPQFTWRCIYSIRYWFYNQVSPLAQTLVNCYTKTSCSMGSGFPLH